MTSLGVATEMSARSSASRTPGAGGWVAGRTGTGRTGRDAPVAAGPAAPSDSGRHQAEMTNKALPFVCGGGRCQRSRCESFSDGQTTRQPISGVSLGYCSTSKDWKEKNTSVIANNAQGLSSEPGASGLGTLQPRRCVPGTSPLALSQRPRDP